MPCVSAQRISCGPLQRLRTLSLMSRCLNRKFAFAILACRTCIWGPWGRNRYIDALRAGKSAGSNPVGEEIFAPVLTDPGPHPTPCTIGRRVSFPGVKRPVHGLNHPLPSSAEIQERAALYLCSSFLGLHGLLQGEFLSLTDFVQI